MYIGINNRFYNAKNFHFSLNIGFSGITTFSAQSAMLMDS